MNDGFAVQPAQLRGYADMVKRAGADFPMVGGYVKGTATDTAGFDGILAILAGPVQSFGDRHGYDLADWGGRLTQTGRGLESAAFQYESSDARGQQRMNDVANDAGEDLSPRSPDGGETTEPFEDTVEPQFWLKPPTPPAESVNLAIKDVGHVLATLDWIIKKITGWSILEAILQPLTGDWDKIRMHAEAWGNVGKAAGDMKTNLEDGMSLLQYSWRGTAANTFYGHMKGWRQGLQAETDLANAVQQKLEAVAQMSKQVFDEIGGILGSIVDKAALAAATWYIPVWGQYKAYRIGKEIIKLIQTVFELKARIEALLKGAVELFEAAAANANIDFPPEAKIPDSAYAGNVPG